MRILSVIILIHLINIKGQCQKTDIDRLQGSWQERSDVKSYAVVEGNIWFSIVNVGNARIITRQYVGFVSNSKKDSLSISEFQTSGLHIIFSKGVVKSEESLLPRRKKFREYEFDLTDTFFIYYANQPVAFSRIEELPLEVYEALKSEKAKYEE